MKKLIAAALILSLVFSLSLTALAEENDTISFTDVAEDNWAWPGISFMVSHGYMNGTGDGAFNPWGEVSLGQALTIMARVAGETDKEGAPWYQIGFDWAEKSDAYTVPEDADLETLQAGRVWRQDMIRFFWALAGSEPADLSVLDRLPDAGEIGEDYRTAVAWSVENGISDGSRPLATITRAEFATLVMRCHGVLVPDAQ